MPLELCWDNEKKARYMLYIMLAKPLMELN
jgi:hypothetical protein